MIDESQGLGPGGKKNDAGKTRFDLLPLVVLRGVAEVLTYGAKTYDEHSWQKVPRGLGRYLAGQQRHFNARVLDGEQCDGESGLLHAWHYACNALFVAWFLAFRGAEVEAFRAVHADDADPELLDVDEAIEAMRDGKTVEVVDRTHTLHGALVRRNGGSYEFDDRVGCWSESSFPWGCKNCKFKVVS